MPRIWAHHLYMYQKGREMRSYMQIGLFTLAYALACVPAFALPATSHAVQNTNTDVTTITAPVKSGSEVQNVIYSSPSQPKAILIMLPGGTGKLGIDADGTIQHDKNFLVRTREDWLKRGYAVLIPDSPDGRNLRGHRSTQQYRDAVNALVTYAKTQNQAPVFLIGTSQGTIAAVNGATQFKNGEIAGIVLTESVTKAGKRSSETIYDAKPAEVSAPVLIVANRDDACPVAPPEGADQLSQAFTQAKSTAVEMVSGGNNNKHSCSSLSPHGYSGIEDQVIDLIAKWLNHQSN